MTAKLFTVGKIVNTQGIKGEIKVLSQTDFPEIRFQRGNTLVLAHPEQDIKLEVEVEMSRLQKNTYIVKIKGYDEINEVERFKGWFLKIREDQRMELPEDEYYYSDILGCQVWSDEGQELGTVIEILSPGANDVWVVGKPEGRGKPILIPVIDDVLLKVDIAKKHILIHLMEGLQQ